MKKIVKIVTLMVFMIFIFGITTSKALTVTSNTTAAEMLKALRGGDGLTDLTSSIKNQNSYLYCRDRGTSLSSSATYYFANNKDEEKSKVTYDTTTAYDNENEYAKAYILAFSDYNKFPKYPDRQTAWWQILGQKTGENELLQVAKDYQDFKKAEKDVKVTNTGAKTSVSGSNIVYGPIKIEYSYATGTRSSTQFGGFNYVLLDNNNNNIVDKVNLCILDNNQYTPITATKNSNGYYEVRTSSYNNTNLYVVTQDKTISNVNLKIQENKEDYKADVYEIEGQYYVSSTHTVYCMECQDRMENATTDKAVAAVTGSLLSANGVYYEYTGREKELIYEKTSKGYSNVYRVDGSDYYFPSVTVDSKTYPFYETSYYCTYCSNSTAWYTGTKANAALYLYQIHYKYPHYCSLHTSGQWQCMICHYNQCFDSNETYKHMEGTCVFSSNQNLINHFKITHLGEGRRWSRMVYNFTRFTGCGCAYTVYQGWHKSQPLFIVDTTTANKSTELKLDIKIPLSTSIEVTKKWEDYNNFHNVRPDSITLTVYRSLDKTNWTKLTKGTDYTETWTKNGNTWVGKIDELRRADDNGNLYYFKVEEQALNYYTIKYPSGNVVDKDVDDKKLTIINTLKHTNIDIIKNWNDYSDVYKLRPDTIKFNVFRSTDNANWTKLTENTDYKVEWKTTTGDTWTATISQLLGVDSSGNKYYFKVEEQALVNYDATYPNGQAVQYTENSTTNPQIIIDNSLKRINIGGYVWLDGQTGIKPVVPNNGIMDDGETRLENIVVYLYYKDPTNGTVSKVAQTLTDKNGHYEFKDREIGYYYVEFEYDGVHYENTISVQNGSSKAFETDADRNTFNGRFETITYKQSKDGTTLNYDYSDRKSTLVTSEEGSTKVKTEFIMNATTQEEFYTNDIDDLNLGLVKRGTDIALSTDVYDAQVTINGQTTDYTFNKEDNSIEIGTTQTSEEVSYNLNLYTSDYNYRVRDYVNSQDFKEKDYINDGNPGIKTGDDLKVYVIYELNLQNQSTETTRINEVKYTYDNKYTFKGISDTNYSTQDAGNVVTINLNGLSLGEGETRTLYLIFEVNEVDNAVNQGDFTNKAEITSYSTDKGLIDVDSQPGNFVNDSQPEDDSDTAGGLTIKVPTNLARIITGKVFDNNNSQNVNDVIVQLIEQKTVNGKIYEYIWQETVSGTGKGYRLNADGTALEEYTYTSAQGQYEFNGFIPGNYIVRFIYGDGTTYDMTGNVIQYNGQDYKSMVDSNYNKEWYNSSSYTAGTSVARDNEARRLETMAYSVDVNASKGVLLKLLNNLTVDDLNETEKEIIIATYNYYYDPDITEVTSDVISKLLKEQVLKNTWMCAETSKIKVAVDTENITNINSATTVNGISRKLCK